MSSLLASAECLPDPLDWSDMQATADDRTDTAQHARRRFLVRNAHLVGIGGAGMRALAELLSEFGCRVTGTDSAMTDELQWKLRSRGIRVSAGHDACHLPEHADVLIYSPAVPEANPERQAAAGRGMPQLSLPQALSRVMRRRVGVSVAGTHGKTTTTALLGHLLEDAGLSPSVVCGGDIIGREAGGRAGAGQTLIVESCEYRRHFLNLAPRYALLLNVEPDHFDCYPTLASSIRAFSDFAALLPSSGLLVVNRDCQPAMQAAQSASCRVVTVGRHPEAQWRIASAHPTRLGWSFVVEREGAHFGRFRLPSPLEHNLPNALAALAMAQHLGVRRHRLQAGVKSFPGVRRRFETIQTEQGVTLIDDYAHHPTALRGVLRAVRSRYPDGRLWCAFQPHQVSRTQALLAEFVGSLSRADDVLIPPVFAAREAGGEAAVLWSQELAHRIGRRGVRARFVGSLDEITSTIETEARPGDVFLTLGAGNIDSIARHFTSRLRQQRAS